MISSLLGKIFGNKNQRELKRIGRTIPAINAQEKRAQSLDDDGLKQQIHQFRKRYQGGESLDQLLPEAFACVREASQRTLGLRHFDVQLIGGMVLHEGNIAEMRTGEGKTLVATLPAYLHAIADQGVHIVTVNDYLAQRDADWMGKIYHALGLRVGTVVSGQSITDKHQAYAADITYGTNSEFGFDYLRDHMVLRREDQVQRGLSFAIVDEVDSILIDEARTPLVISGPSANSDQLYKKINTIIKDLQVQDASGKEGDFIIDEKDRQIELTERGHEQVEQLLSQCGLLASGVGLYDYQALKLLHHVQVALRAHHLFHRDVEYLVRNQQVMIIDEHTGRVLPGRRWSDGVHQAIEAREGVTIQPESQTFASTTYQNYFRLYETLSGMTGTADTEAYELRQIYDLNVVVTPTHRPMVRCDDNDRIFLNEKEKYAAILDDLKDCRKRQQPVLVGTASVEHSDRLSALLRAHKIPHNVLSARQHEREAQVIAEAGRPGAVTIATNMAGRGTDIVLGGNQEMEIAQLDDADATQIAKIQAAWKQRHDSVIAAGGLRVIGSERHESRRIDNQLRGRSGRQGDPGSSCFYLSLEDDLLRIFASERVRQMMQNAGFKDDEVIEHQMVNHAIERAQRKVEARNFDVRKQLLEYDDIANEQRQAIYTQREELLQAEDLSTEIAELCDQAMAQLLKRFIAEETPFVQWDIKGLQKELERLQISYDVATFLDNHPGTSRDHLLTLLRDQARKTLADKTEQIGEENMRRFSKQLLLKVLDMLWKEHLAGMDYLRQGVHLRGYAQKNPKQEYRRESYEMFAQLLERIGSESVRLLLSMVVDSPPDTPRSRPPAFPSTASADSSAVLHRVKKTGRNQPCPCGSGKKFKYCHGRN